MSKKNSILNCPRCLGKGFVNESDILRLDRYVEWVAGLCGYCEGLGKINPEEFKTTEVNDIYLSSDLTREERKQYLNKNKNALERAAQYQIDLDITKSLVIKFHFKEKKTIEEILEIFQLPKEIGDSSRENFKAFISRVISKST